MCSDEQHTEHMAALKRIERLLTPRRPQTSTYNISDTQGFHLDYKDRKHVFIYTNTPIVLQLLSNTFPVPIQQWINLDFIQAGTKLFTVGTASLIGVIIHATDDMIG